MNSHLLPFIDQDYYEDLSKDYADSVEFLQHQLDTGNFFMNEQEPNVFVMKRRLPNGLHRKSERPIPNSLSTLQKIEEIGKMPRLKDILMRRYYRSLDRTM